MLMLLAPRLPLQLQRAHSRTLQRLGTRPSSSSSSSPSASAMATGSGFWRARRGLRFDNPALRELPVDPEPRNFVRSSVVGACLSRVLPTPLANPKLVIAAKEPMALVGIDLLDQRDASDGDSESTRPMEELTPYLAGNALFDGSEPSAQCYCGHQFGYFSGQLGDGAAISLGEAVLDGDDQGKEVAERWEMQLKGAGKTPYSRQADGRKVLVRLCPCRSAAMQTTDH